MIRMFLISIAAVGVSASPALATDLNTASSAPVSVEAPKTSSPKPLTDEAMSSIVGGVDVVTKSGKVVWTVTSLDPPEGYNPGGKGNTAAAAPGLLTAVGNGGLGVQ